MMMQERPVALLLMGPTASGKSELAVDLARRMEGEIVSVDSSQVYRGMDIGTAKPSLDIRAEIPHHLIDILDPSEHFSAGRFREEALALIAAIHGRGRLPILAGGTMLYFQALVYGLAPLPPGDSATRAEIDAEAAEMGWPALHRHLAKVDSEAATRIHPNDAQRIQRALEVYRLTGRPLSAWWKKEPSETLPFRPLKVAISPLARAELHRRIERRFRAMLDQGLVEEVEQLHRRADLHPGLPAIRSVGYRQVWSYLEGDCDFSTMINKAVSATRQLAKRQFTWLRREEDALWLASDDANASGKIIAALGEKQS
ncbi:tRNA (adenosine(37)-N6)-dimethylallyltransferase MiaA [Methylohalobius crimeensis]|uniref:tRNA (adenosine(37)-N6)-dimethylallyltransferase MiaA n=1 Tax=Methylohalobius crimeensis TaxID=244365 RepID=UPI0003B76C37|nr:tRNA (adenosine(37)-N6)-dimethylallyltransferase MiaA [Methylohalobius crimeensis]